MKIRNMRIKNRNKFIYKFSEPHKNIIQLKEREVVVDQPVNSLLDNYGSYEDLSMNNAPWSYQSFDVDRKKLKVKKPWLDLEELVQERTNEVKLSNMKLQEEIKERERAEKLLWKQHEQLQEQLSFSNSLNLIAETIISNDDTQKILQSMAEIVGSALHVDRSLIFNVDYSKHLVIGLCEWLNRNTPYFKVTKDTFNLDVFLDSNTYMKDHRQWLESHVDDYSTYLSQDGSGELLHKDMRIKSLLWYPFCFREQGYYCLIFNQISQRRVWRKEELDFVDSAANLVELAIQKINFLSEQKRHKEDLLLSEERFQKLFHYSPVSLTLFSLDSGKYIDANECCLKMHECSREEFVGNTPANLGLWVNKEERAKYHKELTEKGFAYNHEIKVSKKSGEVFEALLSGLMIDINGEKCVLGTKTDITELRQYQREISRLDRLKLISKIASGIAHEIRNPMTTVKGFLQLLSEKQEPKINKNILTLMVSELDRANSIITEFLSLVKNKPLDLKKQDLNSIIENLFPLIQSDGLVADKYVDLELNTIADLLGDGNELRQLILNLVRNGFEAMSPGGKLTIKTYMKYNKIVLVVQDQGQGMGVDVINKIGTPFFTTKDNGTGLGLATCYSIAARHNASINFDTRPTGTAFYISFKAC